MAVISLRKLRRMFKPGPIGHTAKGVPYHIGNSFRGLRWMRKIGKKRADRDILVTKDGVLVVTHWPKPMMHGFVDPKRQLDKRSRVSDLTWAEVRRLRAPGGFTIHTLSADLQLMGQLKMTAVLEPKDAASLDSQELWNDVARLGKRFRVPLRGYALPGNWDCLPLMNKAGIPSVKIH